MSKEKNNKKINRDVLKWSIIGLAGLVMVVLIFSAGLLVGGIKARFSYRWAESYHKNFAGPQEGFLGDWRRPPLPGDFLAGHGIFGEIIELKDPSTVAGQVNAFVIKGQNDIEQIVITTKDTIIKRGRETIESGLKIGDQVVIIGSPNEQGQIEAKLIRIFDEESNRSPLPPKTHQFPLF